MPSLIDKIDSLAFAPKHVTGNYNAQTGKIEYTVIPDVQAIRKSAKPQKSYSGGGSFFNWGYGQSVNRDLRLDEYGAAQAVAVVTEVQRAVKFWQQWLGGLTWHLYDGNTDKVIVSSTDRKPPTGSGALWFNTLKRFSRNWKHGLFESIAFSDWVYAETYIGKLRNQIQVADFMWLNPLACEPMVLGGKIDYYTYQSSDPHYKYRLETNEVAYRIAQRNPYDDWRGSSPVLTAINDVNIVENAKRALMGYYRKGMQLGGIVSGKPSTEGAWSVDGNTLDEIKDDMRRNHQGVENFWNWFFSNAPVDVSPFEQVDISKNWAVIEPLRKQIAMAIGVPPVLSGDPTEVNYDNADKVMRNWWATDGIPYATQIADFVNEDLLPVIEPNTDMYFGFDFVQYETEDPETVSTDFTSQIIPINIAQKARGYQVDEDLKDIYIVAGVPMHKSIIQKVAMQVPPQFQAQPALPTVTPDAPVTDEPPAPPPPALPEVTEEPIAGVQSQRKYDPNQPRDSDGQFGSGGGSSGGGGDKPKKPPKPEKPKRGKPDWAKKPNRVAGQDSDGYTDYGHVARNPKNSDANNQIRAMSDSHVSNLDKKQQNAITTYTGEQYQAINGGLRGDGRLTATQQRTVDNLDAALAKNSLSEDTILYRGMRITPEMEGRLTTGATFSDNAYTSATFDHAMGEGFAPVRDGALMRIKAPAGTNGAAVSSISNYPGEQEFLLPRNTQYRITGVTRDSRGQYYVDAEIITGDGKSKSIRFAYGTWKADNPPPSDNDRSDKFNWSFEDIVFDEPIETEDDETDSDEADAPSEDDKPTRSFWNADDPQSDDSHSHDLPHSKLFSGCNDLYDLDDMENATANELRVWYKYSKGRKSLDSWCSFESDILEPYIRNAIIDRLEAMPSDGDVSVAIIDVLDSEPIKTVATYRRQARSMLNNLWHGRIGFADAVGSMTSLIDKQFTQAFNRGLAKGSLAFADLDADEQYQLTKLIADEKTYVLNLIGDIYAASKDDSTDIRALRNRIELWVARYDHVEEQAFVIAARNARLQWVRNPRKESCDDCVTLDGKVFLAKTWRESGVVPRSPKLKCFGAYCGCDLKLASADVPLSKGKVPAIG